MRILIIGFKWPNKKNNRLVLVRSGGSTNNLINIPTYFGNTILIKFVSTAIRSPRVINRHGSENRRKLIFSST